MRARFLAFLLVECLILSSLEASAVPDYTTVWETRHAGSDANGGCFVTGGTGTDRSQQDSAQIAYTDLVIGSTTTQLTSSAHPFTSAEVGNCIKITSGTNCTVGWFAVDSVAGSTATMHGAIGTAASTCSGNLGGALASPVTSANNMALSRGATAWVKADATYSLTATAFVAAAGPNDGWPVFSGYGSTRGDGGQATLQAAAGLAGADNALIKVHTNSPNGVTVANFILDCNSQSFTQGFYAAQNFWKAANILAENCSDPGFRGDNSGTCDRCTTENTPISGGRGHAFYSIADLNCYDCTAIGNAVNTVTAFDVCGGQFINVIAANFSGTNTHGFACTTFEGEGLSIVGGVLYGFTSDAIVWGEATAIDTRPILVRNVAMSNIGGYCLKFSGSLVAKSEAMQSDHVACNTTGASGFYSSWPAGANNVTITSDPFINGGSNNFALNNSKTGGNLLRRAGFPGTLTAGGTGYQDIGALQHPDPIFNSGPK